MTPSSILKVSNVLLSPCSLFSDSLFWLWIRTLVITRDPPESSKTVMSFQSQLINTLNHVCNLISPLPASLATHSSIFAWRIPWTEKPGGLQSMGSQRVRHDWATTHTQLVWCIIFTGYRMWIYMAHYSAATSMFPVCFNYGKAFPDEAGNTGQHQWSPLAWSQWETTMESNRKVIWPVLHLKIISYRKSEPASTAHLRLSNRGLAACCQWGADLIPVAGAAGLTWG